MSDNDDDQRKVFQASMIKSVKVRALTKGEFDIVVSLANASRKSVFGVTTKHARISAVRRASKNETPQIEVPPSSYLYTLAGLLDKSTREMVFTPLIDDFHHEYFEALAHGRPTRRLKWVYRVHGSIALIRALWLALRKQLVPGGS